MPRRERLENNVTSTLSSTINSSVTTVTVASGTNFPSEGDYRIIIGDEIMLVTARSTNDLTVERSADGTTADTHSAGSSVRMILTAGSLNKFANDICGSCTDAYGYRFLNQAGVTQTSTDFTWTNQSTSTITDEAYGGMTMKIPDQSGVKLRILTEAAPSDPWTLTGHVHFGPGYTYGSTIMGICARESATGRIQTCGLQIGGDVGAWQYSSATTYGTRMGAAYDHRTDNVWLRLKDDSTNIIASVSSDGINFMDIGQQSRSSWPTGSGYDELGFFVNGESADADALYHFNAWIVE
jgi:hypothetical protein